MKKNYVSDIRYCEKVKESKSFKCIDGLQKKVRKKIKMNLTVPFDAEKQLRELICFWKEGWDYEHFHPVFLNPKVYYPIVTMSDPSQQTNEQLRKYALVIKRLIERLRVDQQIQVNYKIQERTYTRNWQDINPLDKKRKFIKVARLGNLNILNCLKKVTQDMLQSISKSIEEIDQLQKQDIVIQNSERTMDVEKQIEYVLKILNRHLDLARNSVVQDYCQIGSLKNVREKPESMKAEELEKESNGEQQDEIHTFAANIASILDEMKKQNQGPSFVSVQPKIGQLTYILHPIFWVINTLFYKEKVYIKQIKQFERKYEEKYQENHSEGQTVQQLDEFQNERRTQEMEIWGKLTEQNVENLLAIKDNIKKENQTHSRVVFINLDGYESEYNLELARNFYDNLMYISFPKLFGKSDHEISAYEERFYNKLMFEKTKLIENEEDAIFEQNQELKLLFKQERLTKNPEEYHQNVQKLYNPENAASDDHFMKIVDRNERLFVFPISMSSLVTKHPDMIPRYYSNETVKRGNDQKKMDSAEGEEEDMCSLAEHYESYLIRFLMRKYLYVQIQKFKPTHVIISYSNRIVIEDNHFVEMIQELTNIAKNKLMLFPNFTSSFISDIKMERTIHEEKYSHAVSNAKLVLDNNMMVYRQVDAMGDCQDQCPLTLSFFAKIVRFLKVSSGTYNLQQNYENEPLAAKLKNLKIYPYAQFLFNILSDEYHQLADKLDKEVMKADKIYVEQRLVEQAEDLRKCLPKYYRTLFLQLQKLIVDGKESIYVDDVDRVLETFTNQTEKTKIQRIKQHQKWKILEPFQEFIRSEQKEKIDNKYQANNHIYFKTRSEQTEYQEASEESMNLKKKPGMHIVTFKLNKERLLPIYKDTSLLFETNQIGKREAFVLVMNHLGLTDDEVKHYIGRVKVNDKTSFMQQSCIVQPIVFIEPTPQRMKVIKDLPFRAKCEWNFKQTSDYLILYWPSEYDFIKANLFKMTKQQYEPRVCDQIYIARKDNYTNFLKMQIVLDSPIIPRRGCSAYDMNDRIYIFGGVYEREFNYLNLQNDIITFDVNHLNLPLVQDKESEMSQKTQPLHGNYRLVLRNVKGQLYSSQHLEFVVARESASGRLNSFIRPKIDIEFYEVEDLCTEELIHILKNEGIEGQNVHSMIMVGGYGQNFMFPHSLLTYFYHIVKFNAQTRDIIQIEKRNAVSKAIPINLKEFVKNKHIFQNFFIFQSEAITQSWTRQSHYFFHRATFSLGKLQNKGNDEYLKDVYDLNYKFLFLYATQMYNEMEKNYQKFAEKIGERRIIEDSQGTKIELINGCKNNLFITNDDGTYLYSLNYKTEITSKKIIPLINEAILSLDINNNIVCALIKHNQHTKDKCVLAAERIQLPNPKFAYQNNSHYIDLVLFKQFSQNFELHVLFMMKRNELIIVHGTSFSEYELYDQVISTKYTRAENLGEIIEEKSPKIIIPSVSLQTFYDCTSFLARQNQKLVANNFMTHQSKQLEFIYAYDKQVLDINMPKKEWKSEFGRKFLAFYVKDGEKETYLGKVKFIEMRQANKSKLLNSTCVLTAATPLYLNGRLFSFNVERLDNAETFPFNQLIVIKVLVQEMSEREAWSQMAWKRIYKNQQRYEDCGLKPLI